MAQTPEQVAGKLKQSKGDVQKRWGRLSDDERLKIQEKRTILVGKIQKKYGRRQPSTPPTADE